MAKIRRVIRKLKPSAETPVEEQLWPIYVALVLFGGFLMGIVLMYIGIDGRYSPQQRLVGFILLPLIPVVVGLAMVLLYFVNTRYMRRAVQLAMVLSLMAHFLIFLCMYGLHMPGSEIKKDQRGLAKKPEPKKAIKIVVEAPKPKPQQRDFEKPIETKTPEPKTEEPEKEQPEPEPVKQPDAPQPKPEEQEKPKPTPQTTERAAAGETAPRFSDSPSKLSKQTSKAAPSTNRSADAPQVAASATKTEVKPEIALTKQTPANTPTPQKSETEPTTVQPKTDVQVARKESKPTETPEATASPTLTKKTTKPLDIPPTALAKVDSPAATKATDSSDPTPRTVSPDKRATAAPQVAQVTPEPTPEPPTDIKPNFEKRATEAPKQPTLAQSQESVPNPRPRETARANVATVAATNPSATTPQQSSTNDTTQPKSTSVAKAAPTANAVAPSATPSETPVASATSASPATAKRTSDEKPSETAVAVNSPNKSATKTGLPSSAVAEVTKPTTAAESTSGEISPTSLATRKQETASAQTAPASGAPSSASVAGTATTSPAAVAASKRSTAENAPTLAANDKAAGSGKTASQQALNVASTVESNTTNAGANVAADATAIGPSSAQVARQESNSPGATTSRQPLPSESLSAATQVASSNAQKASAASTPSLNPNSAPTSSPARASRAADVAASPTKVESPSLAATATGQGDSLAQPARMALTKSLAGTAGVGQSPNLDRSMPAAADSPSLVASGAARRETATQNTPDGPALSPSSTSLTGRSQASNNAPSSSLKADSLANATTAGAEQVAQMDAAAGASLSKQSSNAAQGAISASPGQVEVDLGPTQTVADSGTSSRAAGGGQPTINTQSQTKQLARRNIGGSAAAALATDKVADVPEAPAGTGGGAPKSLDINTQATAIARTEAGGAAAVSGGPSAASMNGPATEVNAASLVGDAAIARNDNAAPGGAPQAAGQPEVSSTQPAARSIGRTAGGAPQLAVGGPTVADVTNVPMGDGGKPAAGGDAGPSATSLAKAAPAGGNAVAGGPTGELAAPSSGGVIASASTGRAEATEATPGVPTAGGGQALPAKRGAGPALAASTVADVPAISGSPASGGSADGAPVASTGVQVGKLAGGPTAGATSAAGSATAGQPSEAVGIAQPGAAVGKKAGGAPQGDAPTTVASSGAGSPGRRATNVALAGGPTAAAEMIGGGVQVARAEGDNPLSGMERGQMTRQEVTGAIPVAVAAEEGPGGLGAEVASDVGINSRRASAESLQVATSDARFIRQKVGGDLAVDTSAIVSTEGFRKRGPDGRGGGGSNGPQTEESVELGLVYLQRHQLPDGSWSLQGHDRRRDVEISSDAAATALAVLAFQGAGYTHREHKYKEIVNGGIQYLVKNQRKDGDLYIRSDESSNSSAWLYSHALATLALCEAYGMTGDPALREPAQKAIDFIVASQNKELGGWRYRPRELSDTSVTGWMTVALDSGELANLDVPAGTYAGIRKWLDVSDGGQGKEHLYRYDPYAPEDKIERRHGRITTKTMTSVGLLMRLYMGADKNSPEMRRGADYLLQNPPRVGTVTLDEKNITKTQRDTYYWYYTTLVMQHMGGEYSDRWLGEMHPMLLKTQVQTGPQAGSWDPVFPEPDRWGYHAGRLYVTTMNLLSLEVKYRYSPIHGGKSRRP